MTVPRIGLLTFGHRDYPTQIGERMADKVVDHLERAGVELHRGSPEAVEPWEAAAAARRVCEADVDGVLLFLDTWIEAPVAIAAVRELEPLPLLVWGFPMFDEGGQRQSTGSSVVYAVIKGALDRVGVPYDGLWASADDPAAIQRAVAFCRAAHAWKRLRQTRIGLVGYASMGMYSGTFDHLLMRFCIGPEVEHIDTYSIIRRAEAAPQQRSGPVVERLRSQARVAEDVEDDQLGTAARLYLAMKDWAEERRLDAVSLKCQYELSKEYGMVGCVPLALLASDGVVASCEGDIPLVVSQVIQHYLTGQAVPYGDVLDRTDNRLLFSACGFAPFEVAPSAEEREIRRAVAPYFQGIMTSFPLKPGKVTYLRLSEGIGTYRVTYGTGTGLPTERRQGWAPALLVEMDGDAEAFLENVASQHYSLAYGDHSAEIDSLARMLRVDVLRI